MPWRDGKVIRMRAICLRRPHQLLVSYRVITPRTTRHQSPPSGQRQPKPRPLVSSRLDPPQLGICLALTGKHVLSMSFGASSRLLCCLPCPSSSSIPPPTTSSTILSNHMNNVVQTTYDPSSTLPQPPHSPPLSPRPYRWGTCV